VFLSGNRSLLEAFRQGRPEALAEVYRHYYPAVVEIASRGFNFESGGQSFRFAGYRDSSDLFDVVHDVFVSLFDERARLSFSGTSPYGAYVAVVARNCILTRLRSDQKSSVRATEGSPEDEPWESPSPEDVAGAQQIRAIVQSFLANQDDVVQALARYRFEEDYSQEQAAIALRLTRKQVRRLEDRLRKDLLRCLRRSAPPALPAFVSSLLSFFGSL
jgi:RNA polymerase sigma factor (sigma-70 family)